MMTSSARLPTKLSRTRTHAINVPMNTLTYGDEERLRDIG